MAILHALKKIDTHEIPRGRPVPFPLTFPKGPATLLAPFIKYDKCSQQISFSPAQRNDRPGGEGKLTITPELVVAAGSVSPTERVGEFPGGVGKQAFQLFSRLPHFSLVRHHTPAPCQLKQGWRWGWRLFLHHFEHYKHNFLHPGFMNTRMWRIRSKLKMRAVVGLFAITIFNIQVGHPTKR